MKTALLFIVITITCYGLMVTATEESVQSNSDVDLSVSVEARGRCFLPPKTGFCKAHFTRYYYNSRTRRCQTFIYGGCGGNANNFLSFNQCQQACGSRQNVCSLPPKTGPCRAYFRRYYYNSRTRRCQRFTYGGCRGNGNNFRTRIGCLLACRYRG